MVWFGWYLTVLIVEVVQEGLQQLVGIVDPLSVFSCNLQDF